MKFVITGLPRTRTAWAAAYFNTCPDTFCYHEATWTKESLDKPYKNVGNADSGVILVPDWLTDNPVDKIIVIHRDPEQVKKSLRELGMKGKEGLVDQMVPVLKRLPGIHIKFEEYNDQLPRIHDYLGIPYDARKAKVFKDSVVQSIYWRK